jgi:hypothetical protein
MKIEFLSIILRWGSNSMHIPVPVSSDIPSSSFSNAIIFVLDPITTKMSTSSLCLSADGRWLNEATRLLCAESWYQHLCLTSQNSQLSWNLLWGRWYIRANRHRNVHTVRTSTQNNGQEFNFHILWSGKYFSYFNSLILWDSPKFAHVYYYHKVLLLNTWTKWVPNNREKSSNNYI